MIVGLIEPLRLCYVLLLIPSFDGKSRHERGLMLVLQAVPELGVRFLGLGFK